MIRANTQKPTLGIRERRNSNKSLPNALRAKLAGLMVEKVEVAAVNALEASKTPEELADALALSQGYELTPAEVSGFVKLLFEYIEAMDQYLCACKAKIVQPVMSPQQREYVERKRLGLLRPSNGSQR